MKHALVGLLLLLLPLTAWAAQGPAQAVVAQGAWIRVLPGSLPAGGYVTLVNHADRDRILISASSPAYGMVMLHQSSTQGGMARMRRVAQLRIPAHGRVTLAPGGYHLMLMQAKHPVHPGDRVSVTFHFADGGSLETNFMARPASALGPAPTASTDTQRGQ